MNAAQCKPARGLAVLLCVAILSGCTASVPLQQNLGPTLPPPAKSYSVPWGDGNEGIVQTVLLCLPSALNGQLMMFQERILLPPSKHPAKPAQELFAHGDHPGRSLSRASSEPESGTPLRSHRTPPLSTWVPRPALRTGQVYGLRAIANTLTQWGDIRFVNVLVNGPAGSTCGRHPWQPKAGRNRTSSRCGEAASRQPSGEADGFTMFATCSGAAGRGSWRKRAAWTCRDAPFRGWGVAAAGALSRRAFPRACQGCLI